jgi:hypothetical protein
MKSVGLLDKEIFVILKFRAKWEKNAKLNYTHGNPHRIHIRRLIFGKRLGQA